MRIGIFVDSVFTAESNGQSYITSGGVGIYARELLAALLREESENQYLVMRGRPASVPIIKHPRVKEISPVRSFRSLSKAGLWREWILRHEPLDVLHELEPSSGALRWHDHPLVVTVHDLIPLILPGHFRWYHTLTFKAFCRRNLERARAVIAVSHNTCRDIEKFFPEAVSKTTVIHEAGQSLDFEYKADPAILDAFHITKPYILSVATLEPRKNHQALLDAYYMLRKCGLNLQLDLIGAAGWKNDHLFKHKVLAEYGDDIFFPGVVPPQTLAGFYQLASVFVYPSLYEGFGMPMLEAAAAGTPVVVGSNSSLAEVMGDAAHFVSERPGSQELAAAIYNIMNDPELRARLEAKGVRQAAAFSWQETARRTLDIYRRIAKEG